MKAAAISNKKTGIKPVFLSNVHEKLREKNPVGELCGKFTAPARFRFDIELRVMAQKSMTDDGQTQPGSPLFPGTAFVDQIKALGQTGNMVGFNPDTGIPDRKTGPLIRHGPFDRDIPSVRRITDGIRHQIGKSGADFVHTAVERLRAVQLQ